MTLPGDARHDRPERFEHKAASEANWFFIIVALSIVNEVLLQLGVPIYFVGGLATTWLAKLLAQDHAARFGAATTAIGYGLAALALAAYVVCGIFARKGHVWAWLAGIAFYVADGLVFLRYRDFIGTAFHALILYFLVPGLIAALRARRIHPRRGPEGEPAIEPPPEPKSSGSSLYPRA